MILLRTNGELNLENVNTGSVWGAAGFCDVEAQGGTTQRRNQWPRGVWFREVSGESTASSIRIILYTSFKPASSHSLLLVGEVQFFQV